MQAIGESVVSSKLNLNIYMVITFNLVFTNLILVLAQANMCVYVCLMLAHRQVNCPVDEKLLLGIHSPSRQ